MPRKLKKALGVLDLFCISSGAMISSGLFILPGLAYAKTGSAMILAYILASILMVSVVLSLCELATAMPKAGANYFFIDRSMGPKVGFLGGISDWIALSLKSAFSLLGIGIFLLLLYPNISEVHVKIIAILFCVLFAFINIRGVKFTGKFQIGLYFLLISILTMYVIYGVFFIEVERYFSFSALSFPDLLATSGLVFISYAGLSKVVDVSEEVQNPGKNIPLAILLSWVITSFVYFAVLAITVGVSDPFLLFDSLIPISQGASMFMGDMGKMVLGVAALLAFATTANAALLTASRTPMAMSKDDLLPCFLKKLSKNGTPKNSIILTATFMIFILTFLSLENLVKAASTMILLLYIFINFAVIIMRESNLQHYRPLFRAPLYPWIQIFGIMIYSFLISQMGTMSLLLVFAFFLIGIGWYLLFSSKKVEREYGLLHLIERITGRKKTSYLMDEELREILIERDDVTEARFLALLKKGKLIDCATFMKKHDFDEYLLAGLQDPLQMDREEIAQLFYCKRKVHSVLIKQGVIIQSIIVKKQKDPTVVFFRCKECVAFSKDYPCVQAAFVVITPSQKDHFYLHTLAWIDSIIEAPSFFKHWMKAKNEKSLRKRLIKIWKKQNS